MVVWLGGADYPWRDRVHHNPPAELLTQLRTGVDQPGAFLAIDVTGATAHTPWEAVITAGAEMVAATASAAGAWRWDMAVDIGLSWHVEDTLEMPHRPVRDPLVPPYLAPEPDKGPLMQLRARRGVVPFYARDELDVLLDWCQAPDVATRSRIALVHSVGGAGKTHLAAELASRLATEGWYAGFLTRHRDPADLAWLASMVSPLLIVIDYPEDVQSGAVITLLQALSGRSEPACLVLTARTVSGWWTEITSALDRDGVAYTTLPPVELPRRHPSVTGVFQRALRAFAQLPGMTPAEIDTPPPDRRWTTLDLVMLAWLAALGARALPTSPPQLYDEILTREFDYWRRVCRKEGLATPPKRLLPAVGACVSLLAPTPDRVAPVLRAVTALKKADQWREEIAAVIETLLPPDSDAGTVAVRPDPVGERLVLRELGSDPEFLRRCLKRANEEERLNACVSISRAAQADGQTAHAMIAAVLPHHPDLWRHALAVVAAQGGPFTGALERLADRDDSPLPLAQLAETIPLGHVTLRDLALIATQRTSPPDPTDTDAQAQLAAWLNNLSLRQSETGDRTGALASITEAVTIRRQLAQTNPAAFLPDLATSLNNLSNRQSETGDRTGALASITEAVTIRRQLAQTNSAAFLPNLAMSLNNLISVRSWVRSPPAPPPPLTRGLSR